MATTISVVQYTPNSSPLKTNVLQQTTNGNNEQRREIIILRKPPHLLSQTKVSSKEDILITNTAKKKVQAKVKETVPTTRPAPSVARRNARERNRVKQVNNGFANLRQHIPNFIAAHFEASNGRGGNKKLSKVETLRMAVEYIRRLEEILASDEGENVENTSPTTYQSSTLTTTSTLTTQTNVSYAYAMFSPSGDEDDLSTNSTPPPQFVKIEGANGYQIIPMQIFENSENLQPLGETLFEDPSLLSSDLEFNDVQDLSLLNSIHTNGSLSPEMYSDSSLSPSSLEKSGESQVYNIPVFNNTKYLTSPIEDKVLPPFPHIVTSLHDTNTKVISSVQHIKMEVTSDMHIQDDVNVRLSPPLPQIKTESHDMISMSEDVELPVDQKPSVMDMIHWWEQQQHRTS